MFSAGELVDATAVSKGKGFAGVMKRHNFSGMGAGHGAHKVHRAPGAIGACATPARVFKGTKMAGRMGHEQVTTLNLEVVQADPDRQIILIKGNVPGPRGGLVLIRDAVRGNQNGKVYSEIRAGVRDCRQLRGSCRDPCSSRPSPRRPSHWS